MDKPSGKELLLKLKTGNINAEELKLLEAWYDQRLSQSAPFDDVETFVKDMRELDKAYPFVGKHSRRPSSTQIIRLLKISAAAAVLFVSSFAIYYYTQKQGTFSLANSGAPVDSTKQSIGATLTLDNGEIIKLNDLANGTITLESGINVSKSADGQLIYSIQEGQESPHKTHTFRTGEGEVYSLTLPDRSKVWLNAASSLTYYTGYSREGQRRVQLQGEAYFEIFKDSDHPFIVESQGQQVKVLGTTFNINAYHDADLIQTTLLEGSVQISALHRDGTTIVKHLKPNQQASLRNNNIQIQEVIAEDVIAWKEGYFLFNSESLESAMQEIARWYKVEVIYEDPSLKKQSILGTVSRDEKLSNVLAVIGRTGVASFEVKNKRIYIKAKKLTQ